MFRRSSASSAYLLTNGSYENDAPRGNAVDSMVNTLPSLVYYAAVAKGSEILAEFASDEASDLPAIARRCLDNVPSLHTRFSYTTKQRRFICIMDGVFTYCAIMDEALTKAESFSFLQKVKDAFKASLLKIRGSRSHSLTLGAHFLDDEMVPVMRRLAASFVGLPQKEKERIEAEQQAAQRDIDVVDLEVSSPSAVAPFYEMNDHDFDSKTEEKPPGSRSPAMPLIGKAMKAKKKAKEIMMENRGKDADKAKKLDIVVDGGLNNGSSAESNDGNNENKSHQLAQKTWKRNVKFVVMLDVLVCLVLLAIWLGVCGGIGCVKR